MEANQRWRYTVSDFYSDRLMFVENEKDLTWVKYRNDEIINKYPSIFTIRLNQAYSS